MKNSRKKNLRISTGKGLKSQKAKAALSKGKPLKPEGWINSPFSTQLRKWKGVWLLAFFAMVVAGLLSLPNYHSNLETNGFPAQLLTHPSLLFIGFAGLILLFRILPENIHEPELPRWQAYPWFAFLFGACAFSRFYHPEEPSAYFWYDNLIVIGDIRNIIDFGRNHLFFPFGSREPFFPYLTASLWRLFPSAPGVWIMRLSTSLMELGSSWGLYLLGRTVGGRRMGLILMSLWAFSMAMCVWTYLDMGTTSTVLACIWALVFFFRVLQKPTFTRFLYLGGALGFGAYCYAPFRPWAPTLITLLLAWILYRWSRGLKGWGPWGLALGTWVSWTFLFLYKNHFVPTGNFLVSAVTHPVFLGLLVLALGAFYVKTLFLRKTGESNEKILGWASSVFITALLMAPLLLHPLYSAHIADTSAFRDGGKATSWEMVKTLWDHVEFFLGAMFYTTTHDVSAYPVPYHSYFECTTELGLVLGLAYFIARPSWKMAFVFLMILVGMVPFVLSYLPHTGRVVGAVAPLLLLAGWGLDHLWRLVKHCIKDLKIRWALFLLVFAFWAWDSHWSFILCRNWMAFRSNDATINHQMDKDWRNYRVLIAQQLPGFVDEAFTVLCDQKEIWLLNDPNPIYLEAGEKGKDIVLLVHAEDKGMEERIRKEYPLAQWTDVGNPNGPHFMDRILIPFDSLQEAPGKILYIQRIPPGYWKRRFYAKEYGLCRGMILWDERVPQLDSPIPPTLNVWETGKAEGEINLPVAGEYTFKADRSIETTVLFIDGKKIIDLRPPDGQALSGEKRIYLSLGIHQIIYEKTFLGMSNFTGVRIFSPEGGRDWVLGQNP